MSIRIRTGMASTLLALAASAIVALPAAAYEPAPVADPTQATEPAPSTEPAQELLRAADDCLKITQSGRGYATVRNDCGVDLSASVQVDWWPDPACQDIAPGHSAVFRWGSKRHANYAYKC